MANDTHETHETHETRGITRITEMTLVTFRAGPVAPDLAARTRAGTAVGARARDDLERYYRLLARALAGVQLSEDEASLIVDALNGMLTEPHTAHLLWAEIDDAITGDGLAEKWSVDGQALVARLRALTPFAALAVSDAAERYWLDTHLTPTRDHTERLRAVGLVRE